MEVYYRPPCPTPLEDGSPAPFDVNMPAGRVRRELVAERRPGHAATYCAEGQKALFTIDTRFAVTPVFADLNRYEATTHFNGQSTVALDGNHATGESYTIAHHAFTEAGSRKIMIASLRYLDTFAKIEQRWYFAERKLIVDWTETRTLAS